MFRQAQNIANRSAPPRAYTIAAATVIEKGELVKLTSGLIVAVGDTDQDDPYLGVAAEPHDGSTAGRQVGTEIMVYDDPNDIFELTPKTVITASGGSTTTFVVDNLKIGTISSNYTDIFKNGYLKLVSVAADSELNDKIVKISGFTAADGTITINETLPATIAAADTAYLCPGNYAQGTYHYNLNSDGTDINFEDSSAGQTLQIYGSDPERMKLFIKLRLHTFGNDAAAK